VSSSFLDRHHFLLRRLHSLTGIVPIGVFLVAHLVTNSSLLWGKVGLRGQYPDLSLTEGGVAYFQKEVAWINTQIPHLLLIEITLWASIAFHSVLGFIYARTGRANTGHYPHMDNWRYRLQRISGYIGIFFIFYHVATLRWGWSFLVPGGAEWSHHYAASTLALALRGGQEFTAGGLLVSLFYFTGITLLVFHFANGLWTAAITWGLTISAHAQKQWGYVCFALGAGLMAAGWSALFAAMLLDPSAARKVEEKLLKPAAEAMVAPSHAGALADRVAPSSENP
jgi:succinate dehydrogenase / fumarate reductase cytochrome b subunit